MATSTKKSGFERFLSLFTEVRAGEGLSAILLTLNIFLILTSYYILKPVREALILSGGFGDLSGAVVKSLSSAGQVLLLMGAIPLYAFIASRVSRRRLNNIVTVFFTCCLVIFYLLALVKVPLGVVFFLWIGIFNLMVPAQLWAFANDLYRPEAGKRIFVLIAFGASSGAVVGGFINYLLIKPIGLYQLMLLAGGILLLTMFITNILDSREKGNISESDLTKHKEVEEPFKKGGAFQLVFKNRYLLLIALLMMFLNWVNTTGEFLLGQTVENTAKSKVQTSEVNEEAKTFALEKLKSDPDNEILLSINSIDQLGSVYQEKADGYIEEFNDKYVGEYISSFYGLFYGVVNFVSLLMQLFFVSRILKYLGIRVALLVLPFIAFGGYILVVMFPILSVVRWAKTAENSTDYSLQNTVRQVLFLPVTREEKYKAKQAIDTFFWRAGDLLSAVLILVGTTLLAFQVKHFALFNLVLVGIWLVLAYLIGLENKKRTGVIDS